MHSYILPKEVVNKSVTLCDKDYYKVMSDYAVAYDDKNDMPDNMIDIKIVCYVRTTRTNLILQNIYKRIFYSIGVVKSPNYYKFEEMGLIHCSKDSFIRSMIEYSTTSKDILKQGLYVFPVGAFVFDGVPYVCYNIIVPDEMNINHLVGHSFTNIWGLSISEPILKAISPSFALVKGG